MSQAHNGPSQASIPTYFMMAVPDVGGVVQFTGSAGYVGSSLGVYTFATPKTPNPGFSGVEPLGEKPVRGLTGGYNGVSWDGYFNGRCGSFQALAAALPGAVSSYEAFPGCFLHRIYWVGGNYTIPHPAVSNVNAIYFDDAVYSLFTGTGLLSAGVAAGTRDGQPAQVIRILRYTPINSHIYSTGGGGGGGTYTITKEERYVSDFVLNGAIQTVVGIDPMALLHQPLMNKSSTKAVFVSKIDFPSTTLGSLGDKIEELNLLTGVVTTTYTRGSTDLGSGVADYSEDVLCYFHITNQWSLSRVTEFAPITGSATYALKYVRGGVEVPLASLTQAVTDGQNQGYWTEYPPTWFPYPQNSFVIVFHDARNGFAAISYSNSLHWFKWVASAWVEIATTLVVLDKGKQGVWETTVGEESYFRAVAKEDKVYFTYLRYTRTGTSIPNGQKFTLVPTAGSGSWVIQEDATLGWQVLPLDFSSFGDTNPSPPPTLTPLTLPHLIGLL